MNAVNIPLIALFGVAYGLGHPSLASWRPNSVDKTLSSFHHDVNRSAKDFSDGAKQLIAARGTLTHSAAIMSAAPKSTSTPLEPVTTAARAASHGKVRFEITKTPTGASQPALSTLAKEQLTHGVHAALLDVPRAISVGFSALKAR